jgi:D-alanyl-D-alanine dipeptidase
MKPLAAVALMLLTLGASRANAHLPAGFVYLSDVAPSIVQDIRYAGFNNFIGRPVNGYGAPVCILTAAAAHALARAQADLELAGMTLRVYDCYRPQRAVDDFVAWSKQPNDQRMKAEFYPRVDKAQLFSLGYLTSRSPHSRGSTVDATIQRLPVRAATPYVPGQPLRDCTAPYVQRYHDGSMDMGTTYDCMDPLSNTGADVGAIAGSHRMLLDAIMEKYGFSSEPQEWWHFTLKNEPFPKTYFDFPIVKP